MHLHLKHLSLSGILLLISIPTNAQQPLQLTLKDAITISTTSSLDYKKANNIAKSAYWNYRSYKAGFLPILSIDGNLPDYYRTINMITLPDGKYDFVSQHVASSGLNLKLRQNVGLTGGTISVSSSLRRIDNFGNASNTAYTTIPFSFSYYQQNLSYNDYKWLNKIDPLLFQEARKGYVENIETITCNTVDRYFALLQAILQLKLDKQNLQNIDTLVKITQAHFDIGTMELNNVLQTKVSLLTAKKALNNSVLELKNAQQQFILYLNLDRDATPVPLLPDTISFFNIDPEIALLKASLNRKYPIEHKRRKLEAEQAIAKVKSETGPAVSISANAGLTQTGNSLGSSYTNLLRNQSVSLGFSIPLLDWGVNRSNRKRAEANLDLEINNIIQEQLSIEQDIYYTVMQWNMQQEQMNISKEANDLALQRYNVSKEKYTTGGMSYTDFNNAQQEKDHAAIDYLNNLHTYWSLYFMIRKITLYDFEKNQNIVTH